MRSSNVGLARAGGRAGLSGNVLGRRWRIGGLEYVKLSYMARDLGRDRRQPRTRVRLGSTLDVPT